MSLIKQLRALGEEANALTDGTLNFGGCAVYASAVAMRLKELGIEAECIVPDEGFGADVCSVEEARNNLAAEGYSGNTASDWNDVGLYFHHVAVRFKYEGRWFTADSDYVAPGRDVFGKDGEYGALPDGLTPAEAWAIADDPSGWNSRFDRGDIWAIRQMVQEALQ